MKRLSKVVSVCFILSIVLLSSCKTRDVRRTLQQMMQEEIRLPEYVAKVEEGKVDTVVLDIANPIMIVWTDSLQCGSCRVNQLQKYLELYEESKKNNAFEMLILFSPLKKDGPYLSHMLSIRKYPFPVYIDINNDFPIINTIPDSPKYHCFLLDRGRKPIYVGDPTINNKLWSLFCTVVEKEIIETIKKQ